MTYEEKKRYILLTAFADADPEFSKAIQRTVEVEDLLEELREELTPEQMEKVNESVAAYGKIMYRAFEVACKYMIFKGE